MGCSSSDVSDYVAMMCSNYRDIKSYRNHKNFEELYKRRKFQTRTIHDSFIFSKDPTIRKIYKIDEKFYIPKNFELCLKIFEENDRLVPPLQAKFNELRKKTKF